MFDFSWISAMAPQQIPFGVLFGVLACVWIYTILRVARDIGARTDSLGLQIFSVILVVIMTPIVGLPIYFLIRPVQYRQDTTRQELVLIETVACHTCEMRNNSKFEFCTFCGTKLKKACRQCAKPYPLDYDYCPFCGGPNIAPIPSM